MALTITSANMSLPIPIQGVDTGPDYALNINTCLQVLDAHDHSNGKGVLITPAGLDLNTDLTLNNNSLTAVKAVTFLSQTSFSTNKSFYVIGNEVYYRDGAGNEVQITNSGSVNAGAGSITGLPSGTASVVFDSIGKTYTFESATDVAANLDGASVYLRNQSPNSTFAVQLSAPASLSSNYQLTLPAIPASKKIMTMTSGGAMAVDYDVDNSTIEVSANTIQVKASGIGTTQIANSAVTTAKVANLSITGGVSGKIAQETIDGGFNIQANTITANQIANDTILNAQISSSAAISRSKLAGVANSTRSAVSGSASSGTATVFSSVTFTASRASAPILVSLCTTDTGAALFTSNGSGSNVSINIGGSFSARIPLVQDAGGNYSMSPTTSVIGYTDGSAQAAISVTFATNSHNVTWPVLALTVAEF